MANVELPQDIPSELIDYYLAVLYRAGWDGKVNKRYPFRLPHMQNTGGGPSAEQRMQRDFFKRATCCWHYQPYSGGAEPDGIGGYSRTWWYDQALGSGLWYYDYFMQQTIISFQDEEWPPYAWGMVQQAAMVDMDWPDQNGSHAVTWRIGGAPDALKRVYVKIPFVCPGFLRARLWGWDITAPRQYYITLGIYEVIEEWDFEAITWNSQPQVGKLLAETTLYDGIVWADIKIDKAPLGFCIERLTGENGIRLRGDAVEEDEGRPYISA